MEKSTSRNDRDNHAQTFCGKTKSVWLLGDPVAHSISPKFQNAMFANRGLNCVYVPMQVSAKNLHSAIFTLKNSDSVVGANVTVPHKEAAFNFCDVVSDLSAATGTVNTLYKRDGLLCGTTTDPAGFYFALEEVGCNLTNNDNVVILGSGGTARTIGAALIIDKKCKCLTIAARSEKKAKSLVDELQKINTSNITINFCGLSSPSDKKFFDNATVLANCTSAGMYPNIDISPVNKEFFHSGMTVFDAIYNPPKTKFLSDAESVGCKIKNGESMLTAQGKKSFEFWV